VNEASERGDHDVRIPLVLGVTGHRDLPPEGVEALERGVREILQNLRGRYPSTPLVLVSSLAEGADRLAARVFLDLDFGGRLLAALPLPQDLYEKDFAGQESIDEFHCLLARADAVIDMALPGDVRDQIGKPGEARNAQYEAAGHFLVRSCQILIALWDGGRSHGRGGTADVVKLQLQGFASEEDRYRLEPPEGSLVAHLVTPRVGRPVPTDVCTVRYLYPHAFEKPPGRLESPEKSEAAPEQYFDHMFQRLDTFNAKAAVLEAGSVAKSKAWILGELREEDIAEVDRIVLERYARADALANLSQASARRAGLALHGAVFVGFAGFVAFAHAPGHSPLFLCVSVAALALTAWVVALNKKHRFEINHQDFRALAEGLRVSFFWRLAGIRDTSVANHYLGKQRTELDWIRSGLRSWDIKLTAPGAVRGENRDGGGIPADLGCVLSSWVERQRAYFEDVEARDDRRAERGERIVVLCMTFAAIGFVALFVTSLSERIGESCRDLLIIAVDLLLATGALTHNFNEREAFKQHAKQYGRMQILFEYAREEIGAAVQEGRAAEAADLLRGLGRQALTENGDWVLLHRERPMEVPHP
jgi:hypothetical protein